ncbi:MAG: glycerophosphodiester phosphodiesterase family protein [Anaerolineales bacterium]|jgi:glycerophosphoryl diester phosphodiesterase|nr:glycerophosphodiester phosphodiesterase family protein [Anaerolineales bacterium]
MFPNLPRPTVFAHRGASAHAPENTLAAFQLAVEQGADAIEFDVKLSADGHVIVHHDATLERTTTGTGKIGTYSLAELKKLEAGAWFGEAWRGERIPTLAEIFETVGSKLLMNIELTNYATPFDKLVDKVAELVKRYQMEDRILYSSFLPHNLMRAGALTPGLPRAQLALPGPAGWWQRRWGNLLSLQAEHPFSGDVSAASVARAHARARRVHVWTVNAPDEMRRLQALGVDGIFTDDPQLALTVFGRT